jgi:hypothetical protein
MKGISMRQKLYTALTRGVLAFTLAFMAFMYVTPATSVYAVDPNAKNQVCDAIGGCNANDTGVQDVIKTVINILSVVVGVVAVIMIIIGGFKYITSSGDSNNVASAKNTIIYAIVGLIIVALAQVIVHFVLSKL